MSEAADSGGLDGVARIVPAEPLPAVGGAQDRSRQPPRRDAGKPQPGAQAEREPAPPPPARPQEGEPGHRIDERA